MRLLRFLLCRNGLVARVAGKREAGIGMVKKGIQAGGLRLRPRRPAARRLQERMRRNVSANRCQEPGIEGTAGESRLGDARDRSETGRGRTAPRAVPEAHAEAFSRSQPEHAARAGQALSRLGAGEDFPARAQDAQPGITLGYL